MFFDHLLGFFEPAFDTVIWLFVLNLFRLLIFEPILMLPLLLAFGFFSDAYIVRIFTLIYLTVSVDPFLAGVTQDPTLAIHLCIIITVHVHLKAVVTFLV